MGCDLMVVFWGNFSKKIIEALTEIKFYAGFEPMSSYFYTTIESSI
jgi:hypothetical protein